LKRAEKLKGASQRNTLNGFFLFGGCSYRFDVRDEIAHRFTQIMRSVVDVRRVPLFRQLFEVRAARVDETLQDLTAGGSELGVCL
jgi:hypothetical protein